MRSTTTFALVAAFIPFTLAAPYKIIKHAERDADYKIDWITDVEVATVYTQVTQYWTGEPAATETVTYSAPETTSTPVTTSTPETSAAPVQTSEAAHQKQFNGEGHRSRSSFVYSIEKTTTPEAAPTTTTSTIAPPEHTTTSIVAPPPAPTTTSTMAPPPAPTTISIVTPPPAPQQTTTSIQLHSVPTVSTSVTHAPSGTASWSPDGGWAPFIPVPSGLPTGPSDFAAVPTYTPGNYVATGADSWTGDNFKSAILQNTNAWRAKWGASPLVWDDDQASQAEAWVEKCDFSHNRAGQNLAASTGAQGPTELNNMWGLEALSWQTSARDGSNGVKRTWTDSNGNPQSDDGEVGHFTQLLWRDTTKIGCAVKDCGDKSQKQTNWILLCNYDPVGNMGDPATQDWTDSEGRKGSTAEQVPSVPLY